ncbi:MAG: hypothetical protein R6U78_05655 [Bacteroidales bacterium]
MKTSARVISYLFHPLLMPTIGLLLLLNSGTYISLLEPAAKRAILFVMALGTLVFPLIMVPVFYYRNLINDSQNPSREERLIPMLIIFILYAITFIYFIRLPLNKIIHGYALSVSLAAFFLLVISFMIRLSSHMTGLGGMTGLVIALILLYGTPLLGVLLLTLLASGLTGSARLWLGEQRSPEVYSGYLLGFTVVLATLLIY